MAIRLKTQDEIERMRAAGRVVWKVLERCKEMAQPGVTTGEIDREALRMFEAEGVKGLFKDYPSHKPGTRPFPGNVCISVNEEVVHGIGGTRQLKDGDIISIDCGVMRDGWCGDSATTILVGNVPAPVRRLCDVTRHVLDIAIQNVKPGRTWNTIARMMQRYAESSGMSVVREYVGHGIGTKLHEDPQIPNYVDSQTQKRDIELREGMVLAIEPMCNLGRREVKEMGDGWTVVTIDRQPSAHYEHTIAVTASGADVLTDGR